MRDSLTLVTQTQTDPIFVLFSLFFALNYRSFELGVPFLSATGLDRIGL